MCRWLAYMGSPIVLEEVLFRPQHSLVVQSLRSRKGVETTNGDGFGVGWYGREAQPRLYRSVSPAWNDRNLRELAADVESPLFLAHVRASTGTAVQQTNCHPFRHQEWLFMHNGEIRGYRKLKRDLVVAIDPELFASIEGTTDSEVMFHLALTFGLRDDPPGGVARMVAFVESVGRRHGIENPVQMTLAVSNGRDIWAFRYSTEGRSRSLYISAEMPELRRLFPDIPRFRSVSDETRLVVSEPIVDLEGAFLEVAESTFVLVTEGEDRVLPFQPRLAAQM